MRKSGLLILSFLVLGAAALAMECYPFFVSLSSEEPHRFAEAWTTTRREFPTSSVPWFEGGKDPALHLEGLSPSERSAVVEQLTCCGLTGADMEGLLMGLGPTPSVARLYEKAFQLALTRAQVYDPLCYDCMATALTYVDGKWFARVDDGDAPNFASDFFGILYKPLPREEPLQWGDMVVWEREGRRVHIMVHLADGLALHKLGVGGPVTIESLQGGKDYYERYFRERYPGTDIPLKPVVWRRQPGQNP